SEHRQAVWQLRRFLLDFKVGLKLTSQFQIADMMERPYQMTTSYIQNTPARQGILNGIIYTPKKAHDTMSRLSVILSGKRELLDNQIEVSAPKDEEYDPIIISYLREGKEVNVYWLPIPIEEERPMLKNSTEVKLLSDAIKNPIVIDLFTGIVLEPEACEWNPGTRVISGLPIGEYPILICDKDTFQAE
ncbi:MAG: hypothetical protein IJE17_01780, partial [Clostridia bacterium]|nr:hypothetical protein [Clostridia bacterium]